MVPIPAMGMRRVHDRVGSLAEVDEVSFVDRDELSAAEAGELFDGPLLQLPLQRVRDLLGVLGVLAVAVARGTKVCGFVGGGAFEVDCAQSGDDGCSD